MCTGAVFNYNIVTCRPYMCICANSSNKIAKKKKRIKESLSVSIHNENVEENSINNCIRLICAIYFYSAKTFFFGVAFKTLFIKGRQNSIVVTTRQVFMTKLYTIKRFQGYSARVFYRKNKLRRANIQN